MNKPKTKPKKQHRSFKEVLLKLVIGAFSILVMFYFLSGLLLFVVPLIFSSGTPELQTEGGKNSTYLESELVDMAEDIFQEHAKVLGMNALLVKPQKTCFEYQYIGGVWSPPNPEQQCQVTFSTELVNFDQPISETSAQMEALSDILVAQDFGFSSTAVNDTPSCQPPDFSSSPASQELCVISYLGTQGRGRQLQPACSTSVKVSSVYKTRKYELRCFVRASQIPDSFTVD